MRIDIVVKSSGSGGSRYIDAFGADTRVSQAQKKGEIKKKKKKHQYSVQYKVYFRLNASIRIDVKNNTTKVVNHDNGNKGEVEKQYVVDVVRYK